MKKRLLMLIGVFLVWSFFLIFENSETDYKDNFYEAINLEVIEANELDDYEYSWSKFTEAQDRVEEKQDLVIEDILNGNVDILSDGQIKVIRSIYNKAIEMNKRDIDGISSLEFYLNKVWRVSTVEELVGVIIMVENELGVDLLSNVEVVQDYRDNSRNIIYFYPITYAFGANSDYMVNDDYMSYKAYIKRACVQLWKAYGYNTKEAREVVNRIFKFYEEVSDVSKLSDDLDSITDYYNTVSEDDVNNIYSNISGKYLSRRSIGSKDSYSLVDKGQYQYLNASLNTSNLEVWREVIITKILSSYASYLSSDYVEVVNDLNKAILGSGKEKTRDEYAKELIGSIFSSEIDKVYVSKYLNNGEVKVTKELFEEIKNKFRDRLNNNSWLSDTAKDKAIVKLDKMELVVGLGEVDRFEITNEFIVSDKSLVNDIIKLQQLSIKNDLKRLDSNEDINLVSQTVVNAYYQPLENSIVIPVAFFELVSNYDSYYEKLGTMGMIIAHEVTHAFDGNGSLFDEVGNLNDWWSMEDKEVFKELQNKVIDYYSQYEVLNGKYINGERTVNENIADFGAVACIVDIAKDKDASKKEFKVMFEAVADIWGSVESEEYMELLLLQDVHSPNEFRVNAVFSSIDEFYQIYNIYPWNKMWVSKKDRVMVW